MLRKMLICLGASFVLTVVAILYSAGIPSPRRDANEVFENVARELRKDESRRVVEQENGGTVVE